MGRGIDPPWWWKPWLRLYWIRDWRDRPREVRVVIEEDSPRPLIFDEHDLAVIGMFEDRPA
jgi:hypothetical protein